MRRFLTWTAIGVLLLVIVAYVAGVRIFVIQPIGAIPDGITAIVHGVPGLNPIDSPDAFCHRKTGSVTLLCRGMTAGKVAQEATILMRLPYMPFLMALSGAPETER